MRKNKIKSGTIIALCFIIFGIIFLKLNIDASRGKAISKVTVKVVDEQGSPVENANVNIGFLQYFNWDNTRSKDFHGRSNSKGEYSAIYTGYSQSGISATKQGYYRSSTRYKRKIVNGIFWEPWNPTIELVLRREVNPVPLKAKEIANFKLVETNACYRYDLFVGDWVEPYGNGKYADLNIRFNYKKIDRYNYTWKCIIYVVSEDDGFRYIDNSELTENCTFKLPYNAFKEGYTMSNLVYSIEHVNGQSTVESTTPLFDDLFFRIRTEKDENGEIIKGYYGKLTKLDCQFISTLCEGRLRFTYYLNPIPNDRNLEFNVKSNLFQNLDWGEKVNKP